MSWPDGGWRTEEEDGEGSVSRRMSVSSAGEEYERPPTSPHTPTTGGAKRKIVSFYEQQGNTTAHGHTFAPSPLSKTMLEKYF